MTQGYSFLGGFVDRTGLIVRLLTASSLGGFVDRTGLIVRLLLRARSSRSIVAVN